MGDFIISCVRVEVDSGGGALGIYLQGGVQPHVWVTPFFKFTFETEVPGR